MTIPEGWPAVMLLPTNNEGQVKPAESRTLEHGDQVIVLGAWLVKDATV